MYLFKRLLKIIYSVRPEVRKRLIIMGVLLLGFNSLVWIFIFIFSRTYPLLLGLATLAYGFGLRHAVDADHITAIDNTTRKLMQDGKRPVAVGFFFSLGHSTIVIILSLLIALSASFMEYHFPTFRTTGSLIGTVVSCLFLLSIGFINLIAFIEIFSAWRKVIKGKKSIEHETLEKFLNNRGILTRILKPLLKIVKNSWNMYLIGLLFGLGFDTASEIGVLSISAVTAVKGIPIFVILLLPLAFTAGMTLIDTLDGILMLGAYGWAYMNPVRKLYYNLNITFVSVVTALFIGITEGLQIISSQTGIENGIFSLANKIEFGSLGYSIVGIFIVSWIISWLVYKTYHK
jgi:high-affinity nickel-transport protein